MKKSIEIVKNLMAKYGLTEKDLFSFCICAVNFLHNYEEEAISDALQNCSNNTKAVADALNGEKKEMGLTDEELFTHYMGWIQSIVYSDVNIRHFNNMRHFFEDYTRFEKVYRREIFVPIMLGCSVEDYDDSRFYDEEYIKSIINVDNLTIFKAREEEMWS